MPQDAHPTLPAPQRPRRQGTWWIITAPHHSFVPYLPPTCRYLSGQLELGEGGFLHWQFVVCFRTKVSLAAVRKIFGDSHAELTRSEAARDYVHKEDTRVEGTTFELGKLPFNRGEPTDWDEVRELAIAGTLASIPSDVFVRNYNALRRIGSDHLRPTCMERVVSVFWGRTGTGKSRRAWEEAGLEAYPKDPNSKFWDGYQSHRHVVIDEFRGGISISHVLRWFDRYPVIVEVKGSSVALCACQIWITSNVDPRYWYPELDEETRAALLRRLTITHFQ